MSRRLLTAVTLTVLALSLGPVPAGATRPAGPTAAPPPAPVSPRDPAALGPPGGDPGAVDPLTVDPDSPAAMLVDPPLIPEGLDDDWPDAGGPAGPGPAGPLAPPPRYPATRIAPLAVPVARARTMAFNVRPAWQDEVLARAGVVTTFPHMTASGVCMDVRTSPPRPHPLFAARCGQTMWTNYRRTGNVTWLNRARLQAAWLVNHRVEYDRGWFYPYRWNHILQASPTKPAVLLRAPWYSGMAQAVALSLFARLAQTTGDVRWHTAARRTFTGLLTTPRTRRPWSSWIHKGYWWIEEAPFTHNATGDRVFNGHNSGVTALYDYWRLTRDPVALRAVRAGAYTSLVYGNALRRPYWRSYYDDWRRGDSFKYHTMHVVQLLLLAEMTGHSAFVRTALRLWGDVQDNLRTGSIHVLGTVPAYRLSRGRLTVARTGRYSRPSTAPLAWRYRISGTPYMWLRPRAGSLAGLYLIERPGRVYVRGLVSAIGLRLNMVSRARRATVRYYTYHPGTGRITGVDRTGAAGRPVVVYQYAIIAGVPHYRVSPGQPGAGAWVTLSQITG